MDLPPNGRGQGINSENNYSEGSSGSNNGKPYFNRPGQVLTLQEIIDHEAETAGTPPDIVVKRLQRAVTAGRIKQIGPDQYDIGLLEAHRKEGTPIEEWKRWREYRLEFERWLHRF